MRRDMESFDREHAQALQRIWFLGDVHGQFKHIAQALIDVPVTPRWLVFLGDIDLEDKSFSQMLAPLCSDLPDLKVAFIHGNHDADSYQKWDLLHDGWDALALHGQVVDFDGVRIAGLGGAFMSRIWSPPSRPSFHNKHAAMAPGPFQWCESDWPSPQLHGAIYPDDVNDLAAQRADILITHDAPSCHPDGFAALDELARSMRVVRSFHGHHHDDRSDEYAKVRDTLGFDARAVAICGIKNGLGEVIAQTMA